MQDSRSTTTAAGTSPELRPIVEMHRVGLLVIGRKRKGFDPEWGSLIEQAAWAAADAMPFVSLRPRTPVVDDTTLRAALRELRAAGCDSLVVMQPIMGDGRLAPILASLWDAPVVLWATPERPNGGTVSSCSLVGTHVFASMLRQLQQPFEVVYGHPQEPAVRQSLVDAVRLTAAAGHMRSAKVGLVGSHAPGFINMHPDPVAISVQLGAQLQHFGLQEFYDLVESRTDGDVAEDVGRVNALSLPYGDDLSAEALPQNSRYYLAMRTLMDDENLDALALRCWPELPNRYGHWPYLAMSRLTADGRVIALEGDVDGALTGLMGQLLGIGVGYISDWLEHDDQGITLWHPGHAPPEICAPGAQRLGRHFNSGHPLVVDATLEAERPITLVRLWRCDNRYHVTALEAETKPPLRPIRGAHGRAVIPGRDIHRLFDDLCHAGMAHHLTLFQGHHADLWRRWARMLKIDWVA